MAYFDAAPAAPVSPAAREALFAAFDDGWADPVRLHREGRRASLLLDQARERVAGLLRCRADELAFTSSGTAAVHLAVLGAVSARNSASRGPGHVVVSAVEHSSVLNAAAQTELDGSQVTIAGVGADGRADVAGFCAAIRPDRTRLACLQSANHEVGTIQPVDEIAGECKAAGVPLFVDAAASVGRAAVPAEWSMLAASGHKWGGPPGVGVLGIRKSGPCRPPMPPANPQRASHVRAEMGASTHGNVRVSLPRNTTKESVTNFLGVLPGIISRLRGSTGRAEQAG